MPCCASRWVHGAALLVALSTVFWILAPVAVALRRLERADL